MPEITQEELDKLKANEKKVLDLTKNFDDVNTTLKRLEGESTKNKTRAQEAEAKLTDFEKEKLENDGDIQKRLEMEIDEHSKLKVSLAESKDKSMSAKLRSGIIEEFPNVQKGAIDLMLQVKEHKGLLKIDKEAETVGGIKEFGEACQKTHGYLFTKKTLKDTDNLPPKDNDLEDDNLTDNEKYSKELNAAKTQEDFDAVRKKWKRS